jgi:UDP-N-acetylmuramoyl-tripeptide--D-alanyl-D-alanine ligase
MKEAIKFWIDYLPEKPHIAVLGDMLELGDEAEALHLEINKQLKELTNIKVYTIGHLTKLLKSNVHYSTVDEFINSEYLAELKQGVILFKGSHGIHLEKILECF